MTNSTAASSHAEEGLAQLQDITLKLDALHGAYNALLTEATQQLERLDLTDEHVNRIADQLRSSRFQDNVAGIMLQKLKEDVSSSQYSDADPHWLVHMLRMPVANALRQGTTQAIHQRVDEYLVTSEGRAMIASQTRLMLSDEGGMLSSFVRSRLRAVILQLFSADDIRRALDLLPPLEAEPKAAEQGQEAISDPKA